MTRPAWKVHVRVGIATSLVLLFVFGAVWAGAGTVWAAPSASGALQFGVHVGDDFERFPWYVPLAAAVSGGIVPLEIRWDEVEPAPGRFVWTSLDRAVEAAARHGVQVVGVFQYPAELPPLSRMSRPGWPSAHVDDWDYFVHRVVVRYGADIDHWIVVRGRSGQRDPFLGPTEADFDAVLAQLTAGAIRGAQPDARILAAAPGADLRWLSLFIARGGLEAVDGLALDVNRWPIGPEGLEVVVSDVKALAAEVGASPELWVWRFGYPTHVGVSTSAPRRPGVSAVEQAAYVVKSHAILASSGVTTVLWHQLVDGGTDPHDAWHNFGLYENLGRGKLASFVYSTMTRMLAGMRYVSPEQIAAAEEKPAPEGTAQESEAALDDALDEDAVVAEAVAVGAMRLDAEAIITEAARAGLSVHAHLFAGDERRVLIVWTSERPGHGADVLRRLDAAPVRVYDMFGERVDVLAPESEPIYVELATEI